MPSADVAAIIAALPPLTFVPAAEMPVSLTRWYLVVPANADDGYWRIAHNTHQGWFCAEGSSLDPDPLVVAALPVLPGGQQAAIKWLAVALADEIDNGDLDEAERLLDELRDEVRTTRRLAAR